MKSISKSGVLAESTMDHDRLLIRGSWSDADIDHIIRSDVMSQRVLEKSRCKSVDRTIGQVSAERRSKQLRLDMLRRMRELALSALGVEAGE